jgi:serine/threonine-protein kinase
VASAVEHARFRTEAEAVARLRHPNVVEVFAFGEHNDLLYYAMELLQGSLASLLRGGPLPLRQAAELTRQVALGVHAAHAAHVIHRDLKPANVLLGADGQARVADFGLAKLLDGDSGQTASEAVLGTPAYMAPEQAAGKARQVGRAADVWALGVILYECLTGRVPFLGQSRQETLEQVRLAEPERPSRLRKEVPAGLEAVCLKCLEKQPDRRYTSAQDLADDLQRWLDGQPTQARPLSRLGRLGRAVRRRPGVVAAVVLLGLLAGLAVAAARWRGRDTGPDEGAERQRALAALEKELEGGGKVELIGARGKPGWWRWARGEAAGEVKQAPDETCLVQAWEFCLLELAPQAKRTSYRLRAEVRHENSRGIVGGVGLYVALGEFPAPGDLAQFFVELHYNDVFDEHEVFFADPPANLKKPRKVPDRRNLKNGVYLNAHLAARTGRPGGDHQGVAEEMKPLFKPNMEGGPWRRLVVEVRPGSVRATWEGRQVGTLKAADIDRNVLAVLQKRSRGPRPVPPYTQARPRFTPGGALGLFVNHGVASFRNVVLEPLD